MILQVSWEDLGKGKKQEGAKEKECVGGAQVNREHVKQPWWKPNAIWHASIKILKKKKKGKGAGRSVFTKAEALELMRKDIKSE